MIDSHCHIQDERIRADASTLIQKAADSGVEMIMSCGVSVNDWDCLLSLARLFPDRILISVGVHPWFISEQTKGWFDLFSSILEQNPKCGVGEIGLDNFVAETGMDRQMEIFEMQFLEAKRLRRPVSIHCRKAWKSTLEAIRRLGGNDSGFMIHSFSGSREIMKEIIDLNGYLSFSGSILYPNNRRGIEAASTVPLDRMLIETDSPDLNPFPSENGQQGKQLNEPANLVFVAKRIAEIRGQTMDEIAEATECNARNLFRTCMEG